MLGCAADDDPSPPFALELPITHTQLDNGMELVVVPNHTAPLVTALVAFRVGSAIEDERVNGYSHLFEHMMFQGSSAVPDSLEFRDRLDALGAVTNATTSTDRVTYFFTAPSEALEPALELVAGALREPLLDEGQLDKERNVVLSEFDLNESSPGFNTYRAGLSGLFGDYTVHLDPLGSREVVSSVSRDDLLQMHAEYYVPGNAILVLSGAVSAEAGKALAERYFGDWQAGAGAAAPVVTAPPPFEHSQYQVRAAEVTNTNFELWWRGPSYTDDPEGVQAGALLSSIVLLSDHPFRALVGEGRALSARLDVVSYRHAGYVRVALSVPHDNEQQVMDILAPVLAQLGEPDDVSASQLETAQRQVFSAYLETATIASQLPHALGSTFGSGSALDYFESVDAAYAIDREALRRFVRRYMRGRPKVVVLMSSADHIEAARLDRDWLRAQDPG